MTLAFFRRHRKWFMVLMVAAVVSMMFFQAWPYLPKMKAWIFGEPTGPVVGTIGDRKVSADELRDFTAKLIVAGRYSQGMAMILQQVVTAPDARQALSRLTVGSTVWPFAQSAFAGQKPQTKNILAWMALYDEARAAGFNVPEAQVNERMAAIQSLTPVQAAPVVNRVVDSLTSGNRALLVEGLRVDMTLLGYLEWLNQAMAGGVTPELRKEFAKADDRLQVRLTVLKAADFLPTIKEVPEADLVKQFDAYKADFPGKGKEGYGYRIPDKVALEYLVADPKGFEEEAAPKVTDALIEKYYEANKDTLYLVETPAATSTTPTVTATSAATTTPAATMTAPAATATPAATTTPAATATPSVTPAPAATATVPAGAKEAPKPTASAGPRGDAGVTGATAPAATSTAPAVTPTASAATATAPAATPTGAVRLPVVTATAPSMSFPTPPKYRPLAEVKDEIRKTLIHAEAARLAYERLRTDVVEIGKLKGTSLGVWADGKHVRWVTQPGFWGEAQLKDTDAGRAVRPQTQAGEPEILASDALSVKELKVPNAKFSVGEISDPYIGDKDEVYAFRVTAAQENHVPASLSEVREAVVADVKRIMAMDMAREKAKALLAEAEKKGLEAAAKDMGLKSAESAWFPRQIVIPVPIGGRLWTEPPELPEVGRDATVVDECFRMEAEAKKFSLVTLAEQRMSVVIEKEGHKGPREALFDQQRAMVAQEVDWQLRSDSLKKAISLEAVQARDKITVEKGSEEFRPSQGQRVPGGGEDEGF